MPKRPRYGPPLPRPIAWVLLFWIILYCLILYLADPDSPIGKTRSILNSKTVDPLWRLGVRALLCAQWMALSPPILGLTQLKRTAATVIENVPGKGSYRIGAEIPPVRWLTIELQMRPYELRDYAHIYHQCTRRFALGFNDVADSPPTQHGLPPKALLRRHDARSR